MQNYINLQRDIELGGSGSSTVSYDVFPKPEFEYPLSLEEWMAEFKVSSKYEIDTNLEEHIKDLTKKFNLEVKKSKLETLKKYCRVNQNFQRL
jgi:hypothetical protein